MSTHVSDIINKYATIVEQWFAEASDIARTDFANTPQSELIDYHNTLGRDIRNEFKLWGVPWTPVLVDGVDCSPDHPDAVSQSVIEEVWKRVQ